MRKLCVLERDLFFALTNQVQDTAHYLDLDTGAVIPVFDFNRNEILTMVQDNPERYIRLVPQSFRQGMEMMERFIATVSREDLRARLRQAIKTGRAFSQFRQVLGDYPGEMKRWQQFRRMMLVEPLKEKLRQRDIELVLVSEPEPGSVQ